MLAKADMRKNKSYEVSSHLDSRGRRLTFSLVLVDAHNAYHELYGDSG